MNRTERKSVEHVIQAAIDGTAAEIWPGGLPPLHLAARAGVQHGPSGLGQARGRSRSRLSLSRPVAAMAAAAAVLAVAAASFGAASALRADRAEMTGPGPATASTALIPRLSMVLTMNARRLHVAKVVNSVTRKVVETISAPKPYNSFSAVTAAADGSTFVLAAQSWKYVGKHHGILKAGPSRLFAITITPAPGSTPLASTLTPLRMPALPANSRIQALALSPAGTRFAIAFAIDTGGTDYDSAADAGRLWIYTMASGVRHQFRGNWQIGHGDGDQTAMSWAADDRTLALDVCSTPWTIELFDATATGGSISAHSRPLIHLKTLPTTVDAYLLPDGSKVVLGVYSHGDRNVLAEVSTTTGQTVKTIVLNPPQVDGAVPSLANVQWTNSSGSVMILLFENESQQHFGEGVDMVLHNGRLALLPVGTSDAIGRAW